MYMAVMIFSLLMTKPARPMVQKMPIKSGIPDMKGTEYILKERIIRSRIRPAATSMETASPCSLVTISSLPTTMIPVRPAVTPRASAFSFTTFSIIGMAVTNISMSFIVKVG